MIFILFWKILVQGHLRELPGMGLESCQGRVEPEQLGSRSEMQFDLRRWDVFCSNQKDL
jgi:hypothetical protein